MIPLLYSEKNHTHHKILNYLKSLKSSKKLTEELEHDASLAFPDVLVSRVGKKFFTSIFCRLTFCGLGINYFNHCYKRFKLNALQILLHRAYSRCWTYHLLHNEFVFLKQIFIRLTSLLIFYLNLWSIDSSIVSSLFTPVFNYQKEAFIFWFVLFF